MKSISTPTLILLLLGLTLAACAGPTPDLEATQRAIAAVTQAAQPTDTRVPPSATPLPPTSTPVPPTDTPVPPTDTPTPVPPTSTRTPTPTSIPPTATTAATNTPPPPQPAPDVPSAEDHVAAGFNYYDEQEYDKAIAEFQEAIRLDPGFGVAYWGLGYSYALGPGDFPKAVEALETYLRLVPDAEDRAEVEGDLDQIRRLASDPIASIPIPEGKALFYFRNFTGEVWQIDFGPYFLEVPPRQPDQEVNIGTIFVNPGTYTWSAHSFGNFYLVDEDGNKAFEITLAAGDRYGSGCCK